MRSLRFLVLCLLVGAGFAQVIPGGANGPQSSIIGQIQTATGGVIKNGTLTFSLSQPAVFAGTATVATQQVACYTASSGNIVGVPDPVVAPVTSTNTSSGSIPAGTYYVTEFYWNSTGTSAQSPEAVVSLTGQGTINVNPPSLQPSAASGWGVAIGTTSGGEYVQATLSTWTQYQQSTALSTSVPPQTTNSSICALYFSDTLIPTGTYYTVNLINAKGSQVSGFPQDWCTYGGATGVINVSQGVPTGNCNVSGVFYPTPIFASPMPGVTLQSMGSGLSIGGVLDVTGITNLAGSANLDAGGSFNGNFSGAPYQNYTIGSSSSPQGNLVFPNGALIYQLYDNSPNSTNALTQGENYGLPVMGAMVTETGTGVPMVGYFYVTAASPGANNTQDASNLIGVFGGAESNGTLGDKHSGVWGGNFLAACDPSSTAECTVFGEETNVFQNRRDPGRYSASPAHRPVYGTVATSSGTFHGQLGFQVTQSNGTSNDFYVGYSCDKAVDSCYDAGTPLAANNPVTFGFRTHAMGTATSGGNYQSLPYAMFGSTWSGTAAQSDVWQFESEPTASGSNPTSFLVWRWCQAGVITTGCPSTPTQEMALSSAGNLSVIGQFQSTLTTGTPPFSVASATPVTTLTVANHPKEFNCGSSAACANTAESSPLVIHGTIALSSGTKAMSALPFTGTAWTCTTSDNTTPGNGSNMVQVTDANHATVTGTGTDVISYTCTGK